MHSQIIKYYSLSRPHTKFVNNCVSNYEKAAYDKKYTTCQCYKKNYSSYFIPGYDPLSLKFYPV